MAKILGMIVVLGAIISGAFGSAALLNVDGKVVQVGSDITLSCSDGVEVVSYQMNDHTDPMTVPSITMKGFDAACDGARVGLRIDDGSGNTIAYSKGPSGPWVIPSGTDATVYTFTLVGNDRVTPILINASDIYEIHVWMEGDETP